MSLREHERDISSPFSEFQRASLLVADFDGTTHDTFETAPELGIFGVDEAYRIAIDEVFTADKDALRRYQDQGEHQNRTPSEIIYALAPDIAMQAADELTSRLVAAKLNVLVKQIGKPLADGAAWPRPISGFLECWHAANEATRQGQVVNTAIISAGHAAFIDYVFRHPATASSQGNQLVRPDILVSEETIRGLNSRQRPDQLAKPVPLPLMLAKVQWFNMYGAWDSEDLSNRTVNERIKLIGDSEARDGGLAENGCVEFFHVTRENPARAWHDLALRLGIGELLVAHSGAEYVQAK